MSKRRLPDELMFLANSRATEKGADASMSGKVCVVTGSTSGVGLEAAKRLARGGAHLVLVTRVPMPSLGLLACGVAVAWAGGVEVDEPRTYPPRGCGFS
jgi:hypothetical protein